MLTLGILSEILVREFPRSWYKNGNIKVRFTAPVFPSEYIITYGEVISIVESEEKKILHPICFSMIEYLFHLFLNPGWFSLLLLMIRMILSHRPNSINLFQG